MKTKDLYESPMVECVPVSVEKGFAASKGSGNSAEDFTTGGDIPWQ